MMYSSFNTHLESDHAGNTAAVAQSNNNTLCGSGLTHITMLVLCSIERKADTRFNSKLS